MKILPKQKFEPRKPPRRKPIQRRRHRNNRINRNRVIPDEPEQLASTRPNQRVVRAAGRRARRIVADQNDIPPDQRRSVICDGESLAYDEVLQKFFVVRVHNALNWFEGIGHRAVAVVPSYLAQKADDAFYIDNLANSGKLITFECGSGTAEQNPTLERQMLDKAVEEEAAVVSEREFRSVYYEKAGYRTIIDGRVIGFCTFKNEIFIPVDPYGRAGPLLNAILRK